MYDTLIAFHILDLIQKSLERISFRFSDISCPDDFLLSESGMMKLDSICMKLTAIGESIKNLDKVTNKEKHNIVPDRLQSWRIICALWKENMLQSAIYANTLKVRGFLSEPQRCTASLTGWWSRDWLLNMW